VLWCFLAFNPLSRLFVGKRNDLLVVKKAIDDGIDHKGLWEEHFPSMVRYERSLVTYKRIKQNARTDAPIVIVLWGPTGTGKTRLARNLGSYLVGSEDGIYTAPQHKGSGRYYDDYDGHPCIIFDEFYGSSMPWSQLLTITDRYPNVLAAHGGAGRQNLAEVIIFTSNKHPMFWYTSDKINITPFYRRSTIILKLGTYAPMHLRKLVPACEVQGSQQSWRHRPSTLPAGPAPVGPQIAPIFGVVRRSQQRPKKTVIIDGVLYEQK